MHSPSAATIVTDALVAWAGVMLLFYAWRGIGHLPILARLGAGLALGVVVLGSFGLVLLTFGAGGRALVASPRVPSDAPVVASEGAPPSPAAPVAGPPDVVTDVGEQVASRPSPPPAVPAGGPSDAVTDDEAQVVSGSSPLPSAAPAGGPSDAPADAEAQVASSPPPPVEPPAGADVPTDNSPPAAIAALPLPPEPIEQRAEPRPAIAPAAESVTVLFGTDRGRDPGDEAFGARRGNAMVFGRASVTPSPATGAAGPVTDVEVVDGERWAEFASSAAASAAPAGGGKRALIFVHGYNTSFGAALTRAAAIAREIGFQGLVIAYSWPSQGDVASYSYDRESAQRAAPFLRDLIAGLIETLNGASVSILAQDIGAEPVLTALAELHGKGSEAPAVDQVMLVAPDLDARRLQQLAGKIDGATRGVTLYAAGQDRALAVARRFHGGQPRAGAIAGGEPVVLPGVDTIDASTAGTDPLSVDPAARGRRAVVGDLATLLRSGARPPDQRGDMQRVSARGGGYFWRVVR